jgi:Ubiquinol-cytochrome-c reductase complex subunit (QCR10)
MLTCLQKIPIIGDHFVKEIPPSDNVRLSPRLPSLYFFHGLYDLPPTFLAGSQTISI